MSEVTITRNDKLAALKDAASKAPRIARGRFAGTVFSAKQVENMALKLADAGRLTHSDGIPERSANGAKSWESRYNRSYYGFVDAQAALMAAGYLAEPNTDTGKVSRQVSIRRVAADGTCAMFLLTVA